MVRLKARYRATIDGILNEFQFLMVRLKEDMLKNQIITYIAFQFLMVRLKDR